MARASNEIFAYYNDGKTLGVFPSISDFCREFNIPKGRFFHNKRILGFRFRLLFNSLSSNVESFKISDVECIVFEERPGYRDSVRYILKAIQNDLSTFDAKSKKVVQLNLEGEIIATYYNTFIAGEICKVGYPIIHNSNFYWGKKISETKGMVNLSSRQKGEFRGIFMYEEDYLKLKDKLKIIKN